MANAANIAVRWSLAYLLVINSIDTLADQTSIYSPASGSLGALYLVGIAAIVNLIGSVLLMFHWKLPQTAMVLALSTGVFAFLFQEPIAIALTFGLLVLSFNSTRIPLIPGDVKVAATNNETPMLQNKVRTGTGSDDVCHGLHC